MSGLEEKIERANKKIREAQEQGKMTPDVQKLINDANAATSRDQLEKLVDQILEKLR